MVLQVHQFPCLSDNYGYLLRDDFSGMVACVDTPDADVILREAQALGWSIDIILNTHWHPDHAGGNDAIREACGSIVVAPAEVTRAGAIDREISHGDMIELGNTRIEVIETGGHTLGHVCFHAPEARMVFVGDTLFPMGCGRLFEGTPSQMWSSLMRLTALPDDTVVYCAHEYTLGNARFAATVDDSHAVRARVERVEQARAKGLPTVPSLLSEEKETNPFLRAPALLPELSEVEAFARIRALKDSF